MRALLGFIGQILLVGGVGIMLLTGGASLLCADVEPAPEFIHTVCPGCTPCGPDANGNCLQYNQCTVGACVVNGQNCGCSKGNGEVCTCLI